eukprot:2185207-Prymnesium_polylepis.1
MPVGGEKRLEQRVVLLAARRAPHSPLKRRTRPVERVAAHSAAIACRSTALGLLERAEVRHERCTVVGLGRVVCGGAAAGRANCYAGATAALEQRPYHRLRARLRVARAAAAHGEQYERRRPAVADLSVEETAVAARNERLGRVGVVRLECYVQRVLRVGILASVVLLRRHGRLCGQGCSLTRRQQDRRNQPPTQSTSTWSLHTVRWSTHPNSRTLRDSRYNTESHVTHDSVADEPAGT